MNRSSFFFFCEEKLQDDGLAVLINELIMICNDIIRSA